jgi:hypothetical protein
MPQLTWNNWNRSDGCVKWMDRVMFAGFTFSSIFYEGMRLVFRNEQGAPGILYTGEVFKAAQQIVNEQNTGKMWGFNQSDMEQYLKNGLFKFNGGRFAKMLTFEGPEEAILNSDKYGRTVLNSSVIQIHFYNMVKHAREGLGAFKNMGAIAENALGAKLLSYFCAGTVLHEIMHDHGHEHPETVNPTPGTPYACSLPVVAKQAVLNVAKKKLGFNLMPNSINDGNAVFWRDWKCLGGQVLGDIGAVQVPGTNITDLYVRCTNNRLYQRSCANGGWLEWACIDANYPLYSSPVAISAHAAHRDLFVRGANGNVLRKQWWNGVWQPWVDLGGSIKGDVAAISIDGGSIADLYVRGSDNFLYQKCCSNGSWSNWVLVDKTMELDSSPTVISSNKNHRGVYARGRDGNVYHKYWDGAWRAWENLGKPPKGVKPLIQPNDIGAVAIGGISDLYVTGYDARLWQKCYNGGWSDWVEVDPGGFCFVSSPTVLSAHSAHRDVYVKGLDGQVYQKYFM